MGSPPAVGINDDLPACKPCIAMRTTNDKAARWVEMEDGLLIKVLLRNDWLDDMLLEVCSNFIVSDGLIMLCGDKDCVDSDGNHSSTIIAVLNRDLGLAIRPQPGASAILPDLSKPSTQLGSKDMAERHELRSLIGGVPKHVALVTRTNLLRAFGEVAMNTLGNIRRLLLNVHKNFAVVSIEANIVRDETDGTASIPDNLLIVDGGLSGDLTKDHYHIGLAA
ncbi:hypothetical protein T12_14541, partial [Trichinella patagoniensis]